MQRDPDVAGTFAGDRKTPFPPSASVWRVRLALAAILLVIYLAIPTKNYYWDGVSFALTIEDAPGVSSLLHPNHLLYNLLGWCAYKAAFGRFRPLPILQSLNSVFAAIAIWSLFGILESRLRSVRSAVWLTLLFGLAGTWWRFATDADAYIASVMLLIWCASFLTAETKPRPVLAAVLHASAMLIHQLALFFLPAALFSIWRGQRETGLGKRSRAIALYLGIAGGITLVSYIAAFLSINTADRIDLRGFLAWITTHVPDAGFSPARNLLVSVRSWIQLFLIGRPSLVRYRDPLTVILLLLCAAAILTAIASLWRYPLRLRLHQSRLLQFSLIWVASYAIFLFFWSPNNTFYKLFALPAIVLLLASCWPPDAEPSLRSPLTSLVLGLGLVNLVFGIIPYSRSNSNEAVAFAMSLSGKVLKTGDLVYFRSFNPDDWLARYFSRGTIWRHADSTAMIDAQLLAGKSVWLETTAIDYFSKTAPSWFPERTADAQWQELVNVRHRIRFVRLARSPGLGKPAP